MTRASIDQVPRILVLAGIAFAIGLFLAVHAVFPDFASAPSEIATAREVALLVLAGALMVYMTRVEGLTASEVGLRPFRAATIGWGVALCVALIAASAVTLFAARSLGIQQDTRMIGALASRPAWLIVLVAVTAGVSEEIAFRAVLIDHIGSLVRSRAAGAVASAVLFCAFHVAGWGAVQFLLVLPSAAILTLFFLWKRDLAACMLGHALTDTIGLFLAALAHAH